MRAAVAAPRSSPRGFIVRDLPKTEEELRKYPRLEFENWAGVALGGTNNARRVGGIGFDGESFWFQRSMTCANHLTTNSPSRSDSTRCR